MSSSPNTKHQKNRLSKRKVQPFRLAFKLVRETLILASTLPYVLWRLLFPKYHWNRKSHPISKILRKGLEFRKTRQFVGINLACLLIAFTLLYQAPSLALGEGDKEISQPIKSHPVIITESTFRDPAPGYISQGFNWHHSGIDIAGNDNSLIYPMAVGKVVQVEYELFGYGLNVLVDHGDGMISRYAHMSKVNVKVNQWVDKNTALGHVGTTGWVTGPHLHFEVYINGRTVNPLAYIPQEYGTHYINVAQNNDDKNVRITAASYATGGGASKTASLSGQIKFKETAPGFTEPFPTYTATPSGEKKDK